MDHAQPAVPARHAPLDWLARALSRVTSSGTLIREVDGLRFIAISAVVFHHLLGIFLSDTGRSRGLRTPDEWFAAAHHSWVVIAAYGGHFGVHLFFVISGFILAVPFAARAFRGQPAPSVRSYYLRRLTRIEPPYVLSLIVVFLIHVKQSGEGLALLPNLAASLLYAHAFVYGRESLINDVTWSLEIEMQFYLLVPLLVRLFGLRHAAARRALLVLAIVGFGLLSQCVIVPSASSRLRLTLLNFAHYFLTGFLLADLYLTGWLAGPTKRLSWDAVTLAASAAIVAVLVRFWHLAFALPLLVGLLYAGFFLGRLSNACVRARWIVIVGGMCYTIYLYHVLIISNLMARTIPLAWMGRSFARDFVFQCVLIVPVVLTVCAFLFVYTEKPFMRWGLSPVPGQSRETV